MGNDDSVNYPQLYFFSLPSHTHLKDSEWLRYDAIKKFEVFCNVTASPSVPPIWASSCVYIWKSYFRIPIHQIDGNLERLIKCHHLTRKHDQPIQSSHLHLQALLEATVLWADLYVQTEFHTDRGCTSSKITCTGHFTNTGGDISRQQIAIQICLIKVQKLRDNGCKLSARQDVAFIQAKNTYMWKCELHLLHALLLSLEKSKEQHPFLNYKQTTRDKFDQQAIRNC